MVKKTLRSLLHEKFPLELRVELDLLSRRRDIYGEEKTEEALKLLRKYNVTNVTQLGPGTNRYGLKIDGFVVKIATNNDGKIDNLTEFKMCKRVYPHVPKTYEVSDNGTLLVAEYIQPFDSYSEMLKYADQIRKILKDLSAVYLIGDVGITNKNYANWGLRPGTDKPVCLDFAYIYNVSSDIFICRHCRTNSMLVPNDDFTHLVCPNPSCGKITQFEDLRAMIPNATHRENIGDLTLEGYKMTASSAETKLDESRSNYLVKKIQNVEQKKIKPKFYFDNVSPSTRVTDLVKNKNVEEETDMRKNQFIVQAMAVANAVLDASEDDLVVTAVATKSLDEEPEEVQTEPEKPVVAFSATIEPNVVEVQAKAEETKVEEPKTEAPKAEESVADRDPKVAELWSDFKPKEEQLKTANFHDSFIKNSGRAIGVLANKICNGVRQENLYEEVKGQIRIPKGKKYYPGDFINAIKGAVIKSIAEYLQFQQVSYTDREGNEKKEFRAIPEIVNDPNWGYMKTGMLVFIERLFNIKRLNEIEDVNELLDKYTEKFGDDDTGLNDEWLNLFGEKFREYLDLEITDAGFEKVLQSIKLGWIKTWNLDTDEDDDYEDEGDVIDPEVESDSKPEPMSEVAFSAMMNPPEDPEPIGAKFVQTSSGLLTLVDRSEPTEEEEDYEEESSDDEFNGVQVTIWREEETDIIHIYSDDSYGKVAIPIYTKLDAIKVPDVTSDVAEANGIWDWLKHLIPDLMFTTKDPSKYMDESANPGEEVVRVIILKDKDKDGLYLMGCYNVLGMFIEDDVEISSEEYYNFLAKIAQAINQTFGSGYLSHYNRTISKEMAGLIHTEEDIMDMIVKNEEEQLDEEDEGTEEEYTEEEEETTEETAEEETEEEEVETVEEAPESAAEAAAREALMAEEETAEEESASEVVEEPKKSGPLRDKNGRFVKKGRVSTLEEDESKPKAPAEESKVEEASEDDEDTLTPVRRQ